jgi:hypothetical protein
VKHSYKIVTVLVFVAIGFALFGTFMKERPLVDSASADDQRTGSDGTAVVGGPPDSDPTRRVLDLTERALMASSVTSVEGAAARINGSGGEAAYLRIQAAQVCDDSTIVLDAPQPIDESGRAMAVFRESFCDDLQVTVASAQQELVALPAGDPYVLAYGLSSELFDAAAAGAGNADEVAAIANELGKIMLSPGSGLDAVVAAEALQATGLISPGMLALGNSSGWSLTPSELSDAQLLGVQMNACVKFGGCGPNQLVTMKVCSEVSNCELGLDAHGVWRKRYSPSVYAAGKAFADSLAGR